jgi:protein ImuA
MPHDNKPALDELHPSIWRASQLARSNTRVVDTGHPILNAQLPSGGWPVSSMCELLISQPGIGELRLLEPILRKAGKRRVALIQPPHIPNALALAAMKLNPSQIVWVDAPKTADALWAAEIVLRQGGFHAVFLWQTHCRTESLRRLNLAAQEGESLFFFARPLAAAQDASPAPLRVALRPALGGIQLDFVKRRGPNQKESGLFIPLSPSFVHRHATVDRPAPVPSTARGLPRELVE